MASSVQHGAWDWESVAKQIRRSAERDPVREVDPDDSAQEVMLCLVELVAGGDPPRDLLAVGLRVLRDKCVDALRRRNAGQGCEECCDDETALSLSLSLSLVASR